MLEKPPDRPLKNRILYPQYTNPAGYPPLEHSSRILAERGWQVLFLGTGAHGANVLEFPPHPNVTVRRWTFRAPGLWQKLHFLAFNDWVLITALRWKPKWIYASDLLACPVAFVLKKLGFRVLYHEHDSPSPDVGHRKSDVGLRPSFRLGELYSSERGAYPPAWKPYGLGAAPEGGQPPARSGLRPGGSSAFRRFLLWTRRKLARCADLCVLPNEKRVELFRNQTATPRPVICVWNCPTRDEAKRPNCAEERFILHYHGNISADLLPEEILEALKQTPGVYLRAIGYTTKGNEEYPGRFKRRADELGVLERVEVLGPRNRSELLALARLANVGWAVMPTHAYSVNFKAMTGASNKAFDYVSCGLAILVSDLSDWRQMFVDSGYGRVCNANEPESIALALRWFKEHREETRAMGELGRHRILTEWNYEMQFALVIERLEHP